MDDAFGNAFVIEMRDLFPQNKIFQESGTTIACFERVLIIVYPNTLVSCEEFTVRVFVIPCKLVELLVVVAVSGVCGHLQTWIPGFGCGVRRFPISLSLVHFFPSVLLSD